MNICIEIQYYTKKKKKKYTRIKVQLVQIYYKTKDFNVTLYRTKTKIITNL